jgi:replication factor C subunit 3/5
MQWLDQHRPTEMNAIWRRIQQDEKNDGPHLLVYGPIGSGKRTRIQMLMNVKAGYQARKFLQTFNFTTGGRTLKIIVPWHRYQNHVELHCSELGPVGSHHHVIQVAFKEYSSRRDVCQKLGTRKTIIIHQADRLSATAQNSMRRLMETTMHNCRVILSCEHLSRILPAIRSRCLPLRVPAPTTKELQICLEQICQKDKNIVYTQQTLLQLALAANRNYRQAVLSLSMVMMVPDNLTKEIRIHVSIILQPMWKEQISLVIQKMIQSPNSPTTSIIAYRESCELLTRGLSMTRFFQVLIFSFLIFFISSYFFLYCLSRK